MGDRRDIGIHNIETHLVNHHSERITVGLASRAAVGTETLWVQQFRAHPTIRSLRGLADGFRKESAQIGHGSKTEIREKDGSLVVD